MTVAGPFDQVPGYSQLTVESVNVETGFKISDDFVGFLPEIGGGQFQFPDYTVEGYDGNAPPVAQSLRNSDGSIKESTDAFFIGIHSVDDGAAGVGAGTVENPNSLIGLKVLPVAGPTDFDVPVFPVAGITDVQEVTGGELDQQFPPRGPSEASGPTVQAAVYTSGPSAETGNKVLSDKVLSVLEQGPAATGDEVTVNGSLDQNTAPPFDGRKPVGPGDLGPKL